MKLFGQLGAAILSTSVLVLGATAQTENVTSGDDDQDSRGHRHPIGKLLDTDGDRELSSAEIEAASAALKKLDTNDDGKVTLDEIRTEHSGDNVGRRGRGRANGCNGKRGRGRRGAGRGRDRRAGGHPSGDEIISQAMSFDTDEDGQLSKEELEKAVEQLAARMQGGRERQKSDEE